MNKTFGDIGGVIFDMDGTIIEPILDFAAIRAELGIESHCSVLEAIEAMDEPRRSAAHRWLVGHEVALARRAGLMPSAERVVKALRRAGMKTALLTRNTRPAMQAVLDQHKQLQFDLAWAREDCTIKPHPDGVLKVCDKFSLLPQQVLCVGDFLYDIVAANAAGAVSVLLTPAEKPDFADQADYVIGDLGELIDLLEIH